MIAQDVSHSQQEARFFCFGRVGAGMLTVRFTYREEQVKVTIGLSKDSVDFFKREAREHRTHYQKMIRRLLDLYVAQHQ